jgi:hypothetical protein
LKLRVEDGSAQRPQSVETASRAEGGSPLANSIAGDLDALEKAINYDIEDRTKLRKFLQRLRAAWRSADGSAQTLLKDPRASQLGSEYPQSHTLLDRLNTDLSRQRSGQHVALDRLIRTYCDEAHHTCQGRFPRLTVAHLIELSVDAQARRVKVGSLSVQSLDWTKIRPALEREIARIWGRPFDAVAFRDKIIASYNLVEGRSQSPTGYVLLMDVYRELRAEVVRQNPDARAGGRLSAYYKDEFCADLSKLWKSQVSGDLPGTQLEFTSIRRAEDGFSVILPSGDIATYGFVKPRK